MNGSQLATLGVIVSIFVGLVGVYYLQRSSAREQARAQQEREERAVAAAVRPVQQQLDAAQRVIERQSTRIDSLEDELRRGRGFGDDNAARQPGH